MSYIHGDDIVTCEWCGRTLELSKFSSFPLGIVTDHGWKYDIIRPEPYYKFSRINYIPPDDKIIITCDRCIIIQERNKKIKKITERIKWNH